jgi:hypothetical protein
VRFSFQNQKVERGALKMKKYVLLVLAGILIALISGGAGYVAGYYVEGMQFANETLVNSYCDGLVLETKAIDSLGDDADMAELVKIIQLFCDNRAAFIRNIKPVSSLATQRKINETLSMWELAREKLQEIIGSMPVKEKEIVPTADASDNDT